MIFSDLSSPAEASGHSIGPRKGFAQAGNRCPLFGIMRGTIDHEGLIFAAQALISRAKSIAFHNGTNDDGSDRPRR